VPKIVGSWSYPGNSALIHREKNPISFCVSVSKIA
jgi:hypothetical protein